MGLVNEMEYRERFVWSYFTPYAVDRIFAECGVLKTKMEKRKESTPT